MAFNTSKTYAQDLREAIGSTIAATKDIQVVDPEATPKAESSTDADVDSDASGVSPEAENVSEIARGLGDLVVGSTMDGTSEGSARGSGLRGGSASVGGAGPSSTGGGDGGGSDGGDEPGKPGGQGNWGHGKGQPWTDAQDLEVLRIYGANPTWTHRQVATEFNRRFPNELARTNNALRLRRDRLRSQGETEASIQAKITAAGQGSGTGQGVSSSGAGTGGAGG